MNSALWGSLSALSLGSADFMARFSSRELGAQSAFAGVLLVGAVVLLLWVAASGTDIVWVPAGLWLAAVHGVATTLMTILLYLGLARGPISVVAPIVASHPVLVVAFAFLIGGRPTGLQWVAMAIIVLGVVVVARQDGQPEGAGARDGKEFRKTLVIAGGACLAYAVLVIAGQAAVPYLGQLQTAWFGRLVSLLTISVLFLGRREGPEWPLRWSPFLLAQGLLDTGGYLALFAGSIGDHPEIAAVAASTFAAVTVVLARVILKERIRLVQWTGIMFVFFGVAVLAGGP